MSQDGGPGNGQQDMGEDSETMSEIRFPQPLHASTWDRMKGGIRIKLSKSFSGISNNT